MNEEPLHLGLDAGGTATRWALADRRGALLAEGEAGALSALQFAGGGAGHPALAEIAAALRRHGRVAAACAGVTGYDGDANPALTTALLQTFGLSGSALRLMSDIELACRSVFAPGEGFLVYAGTGSVAAFVDGAGRLHRAGGRGSLIDDAGGGHWIAREALRLVWRAEDEAPGAWRGSPLARCLFEQIGGEDWALTRTFVYGASRGELGALALAVAAAAREGDAAAADILRRAGHELARLATALERRCGARPLAWAGRVFRLHGSVEEGLREALATGGRVLRGEAGLQAHHAAARLAAGADPRGAP